MAWATVPSGAVVLLLLAFCFVGVCDCSVFCCALLCVRSGVAVVLVCVCVGGGGGCCFAWFVFLVSRGGWAAILRGASGFSAVCDCGIS